MAKLFKYPRGIKPPNPSRHRQTSREVSTVYPGAPEAAYTVCPRAPSRIPLKHKSLIATVKYYVVFTNGLRDGNIA
jgi:hypothetical protein